MDLEQKSAYVDSLGDVSDQLGDEGATQSFSSNIAGVFLFFCSCLLSSLFSCCVVLFCRMFATLYVLLEIEDVEQFRKWLAPNVIVCCLITFPKVFGKSGKAE